MIKKPLVSVVIPVYNVKKYLDECFASVVNQTYKNLEIILVNDGSTDGSGQLAETLADGDVRAKVIHKQNGGLSDARNTGLNLAKGKYVTFIDSDDYIHATFLEVLIDIAEKTNSDIVQCDNTRVESALGRGGEHLSITSGAVAFLQLINFKLVSPTAWGKLYKRSLFTSNKLFFPVGRIHEDTAVIYKLIYFADTVTCADKNLYYYRKNDSSIMNASYTTSHYDSVVKYHQELDDFIQHNKITVSTPTIGRHKSLRLLSVLNKLALHKYEKTDAYKQFQKEYFELSLKSRNFVCIIGCLPVRLPVIFRHVQAITPTIRRLLGKV